jgi:hypothetical protein
VVHAEAQRTTTSIDNLFVSAWIAGSSPAMTTWGIILAMQLHPRSPDAIEEFSPQTRHSHFAFLD